MSAYFTLTSIKASSTPFAACYSYCHHNMFATIIRIITMAESLLSGGNTGPLLGLCVRRGPEGLPLGVVVAGLDRDPGDHVAPMRQPRGHLRVLLLKGN